MLSHIGPGISNSLEFPPPIAIGVLLIPGPSSLTTFCLQWTRDQDLQSFANSSRSFSKAKYFYILVPEGMIGPFEQGLQVNPFFLILFDIEDPYHLFNFIGHTISPRLTITPKKKTQQ